MLPQEVIRATVDEKEFQIKKVRNQEIVREKQTKAALNLVQDAAVQNKNIFNELMEATKVCTLGQITKALFEVGGQYRRSM